VKGRNYSDDISGLIQHVTIVLVTKQLRNITSPSERCVAIGKMDRNYLSNFGPIAEGIKYGGLTSQNSVHLRQREANKLWNGDMEYVMQRDIFNVSRPIQTYLTVEEIVW